MQAAIFDSRMYRAKSSKLYWLDALENSERLQPSLVGTRSTASLKWFPERSGTRWNASLPDFSCFTVMKKTKPNRSPILVAIVGGSGSGKTWLADKLHAALGPKAARL